MAENVEHLKFNYKFILITISDPNTITHLLCVHPTIGRWVHEYNNAADTRRYAYKRWYRIKFHIIKFSQPFNLSV